MRIPTYTAKFNPSNRAPGASIRARKSFSVAQAEIDKASPLNAFLGEVAEISLGRYRVAEELKLEENLLAAATQLASLENVMANDANIYSVLDGDQPRWNQQVNEIKKTLQNNIGTNLNSRLKFESKFNIAENSARTRLRKKVDAAIAARAAAAQKQAETALMSTLSSDLKMKDVDSLLSRFITTNRGNYSLDKDNKIKVTPKGQLYLNNKIKEVGTLITLEYLQERPQLGLNRTLDLLDWSADGANFAEAEGSLNEGVYYALSLMNETDRTKLLNEQFDKQATLYNKYKKAEEARDKQDEKDLKDAQETYFLINPLGEYSLRQAEIIFNKVSGLRFYNKIFDTEDGKELKIFDTFEVDENTTGSLIDFDGDGVVRGVDLQAYMALGFYQNRMTLGLSADEITKIQNFQERTLLFEGDDEMTDNMNFTVLDDTRAVGQFYELSRQERNEIETIIHSELRAAENAGKLTFELINSYRDRVFLGNRILFKNPELHYQFFEPYILTLENKSQDTKAFTLIQQLTSSYERSIGANAALLGGDDSDLLKKKIEYANLIRSRLEEFVLNTTIDNENAIKERKGSGFVRIDSTLIRNKFNELKRTYSSGFEAEIFNDFVQVFKTRIEENSRSTIAKDKFPGLFQNDLMFVDIDELNIGSSDERKAALRNLLSTAQQRLLYVKNANGSPNELKDYKQIVDLINAQLRTLGVIVE
tara:strand:- start:442 stop:2559 length:2118 start_codon:yes stop_codon:yes gene_type:complete